MDVFCLFIVSEEWLSNYEVRFEFSEKKKLLQLLKAGLNSSHFLKLEIVRTNFWCRDEA